MPFFHFQAKSHHVSARGIFNFHTCVRARDIAHIARVLKVIQELSRVHVVPIVNGRYPLNEKSLFERGSWKKHETFSEFFQ